MTKRTDVYNPLMKKIRERSARAGVIGLGYVGLPLALEYAHAGFSVVGIEKDPEKVKQLKTIYQNWD